MMTEGNGDNLILPIAAAKDWRHGGGGGGGDGDDDYDGAPQRVATSPSVAAPTKRVSKI